jgi:hypothetical protein
MNKHWVKMTNIRWGTFPYYISPLGIFFFEDSNGLKVSEINNYWFKQ